MTSIFRLDRAAGLICGAALLAAPLHADEGMWTLDNFPTQRVKDAYGATLDNAALGRLSLATVRIEGGCTGSFVSPDGLILTNHHCIQRCLTQWTDETNNRRRDGFLAKSRDEELACNGEQVSVLVGADDITARVATAIEGLDVEEANQVRKSTLTRFENECREQNAADGLACEAVTLYHGGQVFMYRYRRFRDVRLVFAPEQAIASFGGDPDNFNFPRWCLDMALLRAWDGDAPAESPAHLPIRRAGAQPGEAVFITGHPGRTDRLKTSNHWQVLRDTVLPSDLEYNAELRGRLRQFALTGEDARRSAEPVIKSIENRLKVYRQRLRALGDERNVAVKREQEAALRKAALANEGLGEKLDGVEAQVAAAVDSYRIIFDRYTLIESRKGFDGNLFYYAKALVRAAAEREKPEEKRLRAYTDQALDKLGQRVLAPRPINTDLEKLRLGFGLEKLLERLGPDDEFVQLVLRRNGPQELAAQLIDGTSLTDPAARKALWDGGLEAIEASDDPLIQLALAVDPEARALRKRYDDTVQAPILAAETTLALTRFALYGTDSYPDATFSLRVSYGSVRGWQEGDKNIDPYTTYAELAPRVTGAAPFALPQSWQQTTVDADTRFNLATSNDVIGGNSGSSLTNAAGELVGLVFDGNIHAIPGAYFYDGTRNRTVSVHASIMLEALDEVYKANALLDELTIL
ncbi:MAG: S46 family peptidase [Pseudomonadota bacterium]